MGGPIHVHQNQAHGSKEIIAFPVAAPENGAARVQDGRGFDYNGCQARRRFENHETGAR